MCSIYVGKMYGISASVTRLFHEGGRWHLSEGNFRTGKGEPAKVGLQEHLLLGEIHHSMHPRPTKPFPRKWPSRLERGG